MRRARPMLAAVAQLTLAIGLTAGCAATTPTSTGAEPRAGGAGGDSSVPAATQALRFAQCLRDRGVRSFPDPDASGELTIDGIANRAGVDVSSPTFEQALAACKDLQPPGFTGHERSAAQQEAALAFARCIREHGVADFPDPVPDAPLVDTNRIPSSDSKAGMDTLNAAMQACRGVGAAAMGDG